MTPTTTTSAVATAAAPSSSSSTSNGKSLLMNGADENRHFLRAFIQTYRNLPILWDTSLRDYTNREKRAEAYEQLIPIYRYLKRDATVEDVKKKINTLRTNYRKELKMVECARRAGTLHQSRCWTFYELDFLRHTEKFLSINPTTSTASMTFHENATPTMQHFMDTSSGAGPQNNSYHHHHSHQEPQQSQQQQMHTTNISELFQKTFGPFATQAGMQKQEPGATIGDALPAPYSAQHQPHHQQHLHMNSTPTSPTLSSMASPGIKRPRSSTPPPGALSASGINAPPLPNPEDLLSMACDYLSSTYPEEESVTRTWACKLKRMQRQQRLLAEKFINEILFEGELGNLQRSTVRIKSHNINNDNLDDEGNPTEEDPQSPGQEFKPSGSDHGNNFNNSF